MAIDTSLWGLSRGRLFVSIDSGKKIKPQQAVHAISKLASTLAVAHDQGIVHPDIKPANIMVDSKRRELVILDFGLARRMDPQYSHLTQKGDALGTLAYMSPEQVRGDIETVGPRSDIYSLGVILYELLGRAATLSGFSRRSDFKSASRKARPAIHQVAWNQPMICLKAMSKEPEQPYQSMDEFRRALTAVSKGKSLLMAPEEARRGLEPDMKRPSPEQTRATPK